MSHALQVWTANEAKLGEVLPDARSWRQYQDAWTYQRRTWTVLAGRCMRVPQQGMRRDVARARPGISYLTELTLTPDDASEAARRFQLRAAHAIARRAGGVIVDPQADTLLMPAGARRFAPRRGADSANLIALSWWFTHSPLLAQADYARLVDVLEAELPEALPRRYGSYEPPEHIYAATGRQHFLAFLADHAPGLGAVWYPTAPVADVLLGIPDSIGHSKRGFRCAYLTITVDAEVLGQTGWPTALKRVWRGVSSAVRPFYGDVRTLQGYRYSRGRYWVTRVTERHPVRAWWWGGLPAGPAHAVVLGEPYRPLWPAFTHSAEVESGLAFVEAEDWAAADDVFDIVGAAPRSLNQIAGSDSIPREYPQRWPFGPPHSASVR
jgi:hypothetical protein